MSRCFPYTRPIYKREDVSLIGSIKKLQIQWVNTKQRKQVSRKVNEKQNKKRSREEHDRLDSLQHKNKKRKADKNFKYIESYPYASKGDSELLERSDLSEEHDPPALVLSQCNSSKCTQNNNNKNAVQNSDSIKKKQGMVIRIKLPLKKHKDVEPESASTDPYRTSQFTQSPRAQAFLTDTAPSCSSQVSKPSKVQAVLTESVAHASSELPKLSKVQAISIESAPGSSQVTKSSNSKSVLTESPSAKQSTSAEEPCLSVPVTIFQEGFVEPNPSESRLSRSRDRSSTQRLERQLFRDLIQNWKPPSIQPIPADEDELDWLFAARRRPRDAKPSSRICNAGISDTATCPSSASSLQPRATYLPELDMYQMPYVIPF